MSALDLHHALFSPFPPDDGPFPRLHPHARHPSSLSTTPTLHAAASPPPHSHPTEPLLAAAAYDALLARQPPHPAGPRPGWDMGLALAGDPETHHERRARRERAVRTRLRRLRALKRVLLLVIGAYPAPAPAPAPAPTKPRGTGAGLDSVRVLLFAVDVDVVVVGTRESGDVGLEVGNACDGWYCWWDAWDAWDEGVPAR